MATVRRFSLRFLSLIFPLLLLAHVASCALAFQPDARDSLRDADQLLTDGHYYAALKAYQSLAGADDSAAVALGIGMIRNVRGESAMAERALRRAIWLGLPADTHAVALLYLGEALAQRGDFQAAQEAWVQVRSCDQNQHAPSCSYLGIRRVLQAEWAVKHGNYFAALVNYRAALRAGLPDEWATVARYRVALLRAGSNPEQALTDLPLLRLHQQTAEGAVQPTTSRVALLVPLLPDIGQDAEQLRVLLESERPRRAQMLGQFYFDRGFYALAKAQFAQVDSQSSLALKAAAYAAYTHWRAGENREGLWRLKQLVMRYRNEPTIRSLLALAHTAQGNAGAARAHIEVLMRRFPAHPETYLALAAWYRAERDYEQANRAYQQLFRTALSRKEGAYTLLVARFYLESTYELCSDGRIVAEVAVQELPDSAEAWTTLAGTRYYCGDRPGAIGAAKRALAQEQRADALLYLGLALAASGKKEEAFTALVQAADVAPASVWRERAEQALQGLP